MNKYTTDQYGAAYEFSEEHNAYLFIGQLNGRSLSQLLKDLKDIDEKELRKYQLRGDTWTGWE